MGVKIASSTIRPGAAVGVYPKTGYWMSEPGALSTGAPSQNVVRYMPLDLPVGTALDRIGIEHTVAGGAGSVIRLGIYNDDGYGQPGSLLIDAGTLDATVAGAFQSLTIAVTTRTPRIHCAVAAQGSASTPTLRFLAAPVRDPYFTTSNMTSAQNMALTGAATGAFPATASVSGVSGTTGFIQVRIG